MPPMRVAPSGPGKWRMSCRCAAEAGLHSQALEHLQMLFEVGFMMADKFRPKAGEVGQARRRCFKTTSSCLQTLA